MNSNKQWVCCDYQGALYSLRMQCHNNPSALCKCDILQVAAAKRWVDGWFSQKRGTLAAVSAVDKQDAWLLTWAAVFKFRHNVTFRPQVWLLQMTQLLKGTVLVAPGFLQMSKTTVAGKIHHEKGRTNFESEPSFFFALDLGEGNSTHLHQT